MLAELDLNATVEALPIATIFSSILHGVTWLQFYSYYSSHCSRDRWRLKFLVALLMLVDSVNMAFIGHANYYVSVTQWGDTDSLLSGDLPWSFPRLSEGSRINWPDCRSFCTADLSL
ncbi:hypothetical protein EI94DRAFT_194350 [Lactarius quietus]|nr:hypothetical protein EI94DRAFT_194350 [Lactarius quietus]